MRRARQDLGFVAIKVEGGILPAEFLQKVAALEAKGQAARDYSLPKGTTVKDEIGRAWRIASAEWREYRDNIGRKDVDGTKLTVDGWLTTLLKVVLGHADIDKCSPVHKGDRTFPITHRSAGGAVPLVLTTANYRLDKTDGRFGDDGRKRSPHVLMQEFLNANDDCLWGIVSNGLIIQLLRDNPSLTRPAYIEADLERIFEEQLYSDFAAMWLIFHGSRFLCPVGKPSECFLEEWRKEGHETGERALADLRKGVTTALKELGTGFLQPNQNVGLKEALKSGDLSPEAYFRELLRLVYRLLFLLCVEDRNLLHAGDTSEEARLLYRAGYSMNRLRECALLKRNYDRYCDLWEGLAITFKGLRRGEKMLGLPALGGLFADGHCPYIERSVIENQFLLRAIYALSFFRTGDILARVNYRDMGTEELGSVYESLLELHPSVDVASSPWKFEFIGEGNGSGGSERKLSGSYYTPASLVNELLRSAVDPVIEEVKQRNPENPRKALLEIKIIDPACGSGHFLLAAGRRLAIEIAKLDMTSDVSEEAARRHALREVVRCCIYGVDKNELALELCKTALWIEAVEPGRPLTFLDAHLRCGDSLVGVLNPEIIEKGLPDEAYTVQVGDDKAVVNQLKRQNKDDKYEYAVVQGSIFDQTSMAMLTETRESVNKMPEETIEQIEAKQEAFKKWLAELDKSQEEVKANLFVGAFFAEKSKDNITLVPRTEDLNRIKRGLAARSGIVELCHELAERYGFFHWYLAFSEVFKKGGFDIVLGNPPWEQTEVKETEWFTTRDREIACATGAARKKLIENLASQNPKLYAEFVSEVRRVDTISQFIRASQRYSLCNRGRINSYAVFAETMRSIVGPYGRMGCIVPSGIATDDTTKEFFWDIVNTGELEALYDFENKEGLFPAVHNSQKFCLLTLRGSSLVTGSDNAEFVCFARNISDINDETKRFSLGIADLEFLNPNTRTCPMFRSRADFELTKSIYSRLPILIKEKPDENIWDIRFKQGLFNMTTDSHRFQTRANLEDAGWTLRGNVYEKEGTFSYLPLYEAKMIAQYDHRASQVVISKTAAIRQAQGQDLTDREHAMPDYLPMPRYWVSEPEVLAELPDGFCKDWFCAFINVTAPTNSRTAIGSLLPRVAVGHSLPLILFPEDCESWLAAMFLASWCSFAFDYVCRQKIGGINLSFFIVKQLPMPTPNYFRKGCPWDRNFQLYEWLLPRIAELSYTAWDLKAFGEACGFREGPFVWNQDRRFILRCEVEAAMFHCFGVSRTEAEYIFDSFVAQKNFEEKIYGQFRTKNAVLSCYDEMSACERRKEPFASTLKPGPTLPLAIDVS